MPFPSIYTNNAIVVKNFFGYNFKRVPTIRVVIKSWGPGILPAYEESGPRVLLLENRRKIEPKEVPSSLIPRLLVVFTRQLEILVTTLHNGSEILNLILNYFFWGSCPKMSLYFISVQ